MVKKISNSTEFIGKKVKVVIDRPLGTRHRKFREILYKVNYGHIPNTLSHDGEELDAYVLGINVPRSKFSGTCIAVLRRSEEDDDKLIVAPEGHNYSDDEILRAVEFQEKFFTPNILRAHPLPSRRPA